jgi:UDP-N-acetylmuramate--alanine ligase
VYLTHIYPARETPIAGVTSALVEQALARAGGRLAWSGRRDDLAAALAADARSGDVILTLGAGDITRSGPELLEHLRRG